MRLADLKPGDHVDAFVWTGVESQGLIYLTVVRVNHKTVTVRYEPPHVNEGKAVRIEPQHLNEKISLSAWDDHLKWLEGRRQP